MLDQSSSKLQHGPAAVDRAHFGSRCFQSQQSVIVLSSCPVDFFYFGKQTSFTMFLHYTLSLVCDRIEGQLR